MPPVTARTLLRLALPAAASAILNNAFRVIDQYAAGSIGTSAQAAIGSCTFVLIAFYALALVVAAGAGPLVARATGARDDAGRRRLFGNAMTGAVGVGVVITGLGAVGAPWIAGALGLDGETAAAATSFLRTLTVFGVPMAVQPVLDAVLVALGRTGLMMTLQIAAAVVNAVLNPLLIHEAGLGVAGAALATGIARLAVVALGLWVLWRDLRPAAADLRPDASLPRLLRMGLPITINTLAYAFVYWLLLKTTISPLGPAVNAALGIGFSALEGVSYPLFLGLSLGVSSLVGRNLGAGRPDQARRAAIVGLPMTTALGVGAGLVFHFAARPLCDVFTDDPAVLDAAVTYARVLAWSQVFVAWEALAEGVLSGAGDTRTIFWLSAPVNALRVPLAWAFAFPLGMGAEGVWWAINLTSVMKAAGKGWAAWKGAWARLEV